MFPKEQRVKLSRDFHKLFKAGGAFYCDNLKLQILRNGPEDADTISSDTSHTRFAVITPKGIGKAHLRNRIRRIILHTLRADRDTNPDKYQTIEMLAIYVKPSADQAERARPEYQVLLEQRVQKNLAKLLDI